MQPCCQAHLSSRRKKDAPGWRACRRRRGGPWHACPPGCLRVRQGTAHDTTLTKHELAQGMLQQLPPPCNHVHASQQPKPNCRCTTHHRQAPLPPALTLWLKCHRWRGADGCVELVGRLLLGHQVCQRLAVPQPLSAGHATLQVKAGGPASAQSGCAGFCKGVGRLDPWLIGSHAASEGGAKP